jgi:hypothetical protein
MSTHRHHVVIAGTGRAGTTFLVELLIYLGFDTGFTKKDIESVHPSIRGGLGKGKLKKGIRNPNAPYIIKDTWMHIHARSVFRNPDIIIDHMFVPIRDINEAAESRRLFHKVTQSNKRIRSRALVGTNSMKKGDQERELEKNTYQFFHDLSKTTIPVTLIHYPLLVLDSNYLYKKLTPILEKEKISFVYFDAVFKEVVNPEWIKKYQ